MYSQPVIDEDCAECLGRVLPGPVALPLARHSQPGDRYDTGHDHASHRHLVRFGAHTPGRIGRRVNFIALALHERRNRRPE
jgi:hypothetical protein